MHQNKPFSLLLSKFIETPDVARNHTTTQPNLGPTNHVSRRPFSHIPPIQTQTQSKHIILAYAPALALALAPAQLFKLFFFFFYLNLTVCVNFKIHVTTAPVTASFFQRGPYIASHVNHSTWTSLIGPTSIS